MDPDFDKKVLSGIEAERDTGFNPKDDPILHELVEKACFIKYEEIDKLSPGNRHYLEALERNKLIILEVTAQKLEDAEFGTLYPENRETKAVTRIIKMGEEDSELVVEDINNNNKKTPITRGMAIEAARWNSFDGVGFELGQHGVEILRKIIRSRALRELEEIRDQEMATIMIAVGPASYRPSYKEKFETIGSALKDRKGGEIAEELVASWIRVLCEDGLLPFDFTHADIIDDIQSNMDYICDEPMNNIPPANRIAGKSHMRHAIDFTVNRNVGVSNRKWTAIRQNVQGKARKEGRPNEEAIDTTHVIEYHFPHREGEYVRDWESWKQGTFRGPEMALDAASRERLMERFLSNICSFMSRDDINKAIGKMKKMYAGMYRN